MLDAPLWFTVMQLLLLHSLHKLKHKFRDVKKVEQQNPRHPYRLSSLRSGPADGFLATLGWRACSQARKHQRSDLQALKKPSPYAHSLTVIVGSFMKTNLRKQKLERLEAGLHIVSMNMFAILSRARH